MVILLPDSMKKETTSNLQLYIFHTRYKHTKRSAYWN